MSFIQYWCLIGRGGQLHARRFDVWIPAGALRDCMFRWTRLPCGNVGLTVTSPQNTCWSFRPSILQSFIIFFLHLPEKTSVSKFFTEWLYLTRLVTSLLSLRKYISLKKHLINRKCLLCYEVIFITRCKPSSHLFTLNNFSVFLFNFQIILLISTLFLSWKRGQILSHVSK